MTSVEAIKRSAASSVGSASCVARWRCSTQDGTSSSRTCRRRPTRVALAVCASLQRAASSAWTATIATPRAAHRMGRPARCAQAGLRRRVVLRRATGHAMREGEILFIDELTACPRRSRTCSCGARRRICRYHTSAKCAPSQFSGRRHADPVEYIATGHLYEALRDRFEHLRLDYESATEERRSCPPRRALSPGPDPHGRAPRSATRRHPLFVAVPRCARHVHCHGPEECARPTVYRPAR